MNEDDYFLKLENFWNGGVLTVIYNTTHHLRVTEVEGIFHIFHYFNSDSCNLYGKKYHDDEAAVFLQFDRSRISSSFSPILQCYI